MATKQLWRVVYSIDTQAYNDAYVAVGLNKTHERVVQKLFDEVTPGALDPNSFKIVTMIKFDAVVIP